MTNQELLNNLLNDPEVRDLLTKLNTGENVNSVLNNNGVNSSYSVGNCGCWPQPKPRNNDFGLGIILLLLLCCCGCGGGGFFCC